MANLWCLPSNCVVDMCTIFFQITPESSGDRLEPISSQLLPSNCKILLLADVDGDGKLELVTGHADRSVYVHKLETGCREETDVQNHPTIGIGFTLLTFH